MTDIFRCCFAFLQGAAMHCCRAVVFTVLTWGGALAALALPGVAAASCYSVFSAQQVLLYRHSEAPVDLTQPLRHSVEQRFGAGAALVIDQRAGECPSHGVPVSHALPFQWQEPVRERVEVGANSWPATEGGRVHGHHHHHSFHGRSTAPWHGGPGAHAGGPGGRHAGR